MDFDVQLVYASSLEVLRRGTSIELLLRHVHVLDDFALGIYTCQCVDC